MAGYREGVMGDGEERVGQEGEGREREGYI